MAGNHSLVPTFVLDIDGIAILSALAFGYEDGVTTRCGTFSNRRMVSGRLRPQYVLFGLGIGMVEGFRPLSPPRASGTGCSAGRMAS